MPCFDCVPSVQRAEDERSRRPPLSNKLRPVDEDADNEAELLAGFPFLEIQIVQDRAFRMLVESFFATDRHHRPKGMIEVAL